MMNENAQNAVKTELEQDAGDIEDFNAREKEPDYAFEDVVEDLKRCGRI
jgi:hypothetical protein